MKVKRMNNVILLTCAIVFILQSIGYFSPAWFIKQKFVDSNTGGLKADDRIFQFPQFQNEADEGNNRQLTVTSTMASLTEKVEGGTFPSGLILCGRNCLSSGTELPSSLSTTMTTVMRPGRPVQKRSDREDDSDIALHDEESTNDGIIERPIKEPSNTQEGATKPPGTLIPPATVERTKPPQIISRPPERDPQPMPPVRPTQPSDEKEDSTVGRRPIAWFGGGDKREPDIINVTKAGGETGHIQPRGSDKDSMGAQEMRDGDRKLVLSLRAGLWYGQACIFYSKNRTEEHIIDDDIEWCTFYIRTDDVTLESNKNMFEFRIETTVALALSALSLVLISTGCCTSRRHGTRAALSLTSLFISGGVMLVPVVHVILEHIRKHGDVMGKQRPLAHDLFDCYSVILCAVASILSVLVTIVITIAHCRSSSSPNEKYDVTNVDRNKEFAVELPESCMRSARITVPEVTKVTDDVRDETESGYCEMKDETTSDVNTGSEFNSRNDVNDFGQLELVADELKTFEI